MAMIWCLRQQSAIELDFIFYKEVNNEIINTGKQIYICTYIVGYSRIYI